MVWPERRLKLLAPPGAAGLAGFQVLLGVLGLKHAVEWDEELEEQAVHKKDKWDKVFEELITTDLIVWPGISQFEHKQNEARNQGIMVMSPAQFLETCWQAEHILSVDPSCARIHKKPVLWTILQEAGFAPSLLWYEQESGWQGIRGSGTYWIVPGKWLSEVSEQNPGGRIPMQSELSWVVRSECIDFYENRECLKFRGSMPRWTEPLGEQGACQAVAQALGLGISWMDIRRALGQEQSKQGWLTDDFGWTQGPDREKLPVEEANDLEGRRAG